MSGLAYADVYVNGYYRSNGTYVNGYYRSSPNSNPYDNYSYPGNYNPYTGVTAPGNSDTYLNNYYGGSTGGTSGGSTYYSIPTPVPTPSCPFMSSYNSTTKTCQCYSGYVVDGSSCTSGLSYCYKNYGIYSSFNSLTKSCECDSGYSLSSGTCTKIQKPIYYQTIAPTPFPTPLTCTYGFLPRNGRCISNTQDCINSFGPNVSGVPGTNNSSCSCVAGYIWNTTKTACVWSPPTPIPTIRAVATIAPFPVSATGSTVGNSTTPLTPFPVTLSCKNGYATSLDKKKCYRLPTNAHVASDGKNVWLCNDGYTEKGNSCILNTSTPSPTPTVAPEASKSFWSKLKFW